MITSEIIFLVKSIYNNCSLQITNIISHNESKEYKACSFLLNEDTIIYRKSKITPKKIGQFVTFWKRSNSGSIEPFHEKDEFDFFVINCTSENKIGHFVFPKSILIQKGIISSTNKEGKRAFRVYPIWEKAINKQAITTQSWQKDYFILLSNELDFELEEKCI